MDTNVLIYAADRDAADHGACRDLLERCRRLSEPWYLTWGIVYEFLPFIDVLDPVTGERRSTARRRT